jgi:hypothetical protein
MNDKIPFVPLLRGIPILQDSEGKTFFTRMFECPYCTGFHTGWITWALLNFQEILMRLFIWWEVVIWVLVWGFASSAACYIIDTAVILVEKKTPQ